MFDDPKKDLKWLEEQLLAEEEPQEESAGEDWFDEEDWLEDELKEAHALLGDDPARGARENTRQIYNYEEEDEELAVYADTPRKSGDKKKKEKKPKKEKGIGGLVFLACLETLGIVAVLLWWVLWLL